jgi:hypothetical protein
MSSNVTVTIAITGVNDAPFAQNDFLATTEDMPLVFPAASLTANDFDPEDQPLSITGVTGGTNGTVALASGNVTFTPTAGFSGTGQFTYTVSDGALSDTGTVFISIGAANAPPLAPFVTGGVLQAGEQCDDGRLERRGLGAPACVP